MKRSAPRGVQPNFVTRPRVTKMPAFAYGSGPRRRECSQILYAPARNENAGIRVRKRPAPRGKHADFVPARPRVIKKALSLDQETEPCSAVPLLLLRLRGTTRNAITGVNRPRLRICTRQTSGGCSGVIFTRRGTALHRPAALWIRGGRCLSPSQRKILNYLPFFGS